MIPEILSDSRRIPVGDGEIFLASALQGRIFAAMDGEILQRLDHASLKHAPDEFCNLGGNSLWPAPEGGAFAFNYPSDGGSWRVQDGINNTPCEISPDEPSMSKRISLENRAGVRAELLFRRILHFPAGNPGKKYGLKSLVYSSNDSWELTSPLPPDRFLISAWSLEQFELTPNAFAFGVSEKPLNKDFYGDPLPYQKCENGEFRFSFTAPERLQIGVPESAKAGMIGAFIPERDLLILRRLVSADPGRRINFADNEQKDGVYSASDAYSIFYGATMNFFELETLAPVRMNLNGLVSGSRMETETHFYRGRKEDLAALLANEFNFQMEVLK